MTPRYTEFTRLEASKRRFRTAPFTLLRSCSLTVMAAIATAMTLPAMAGPEDQNTKFPVSVGIGDTMVPGIADSGGWTTLSFEDAKKLGLLDANGDPKTGDNDPKPSGEASLGGTGGGKVKGHIFKKVKLKVQPKKADGTNNGDPKEVEVDVFVPKKPADQDGASDAEKAKKTGSVITKTGANLASQIKLTDDGADANGKDKRGTAWAAIAPAQKVPVQSDPNSGDDHWEETVMQQVIINGQPMTALMTSCPVTMIPQAWAPFLHVMPTRTYLLDSEGQAMLFMSGHIDVMPEDGALGFPVGLATVQLHALGGSMVTIEHVAIAINPDPAFNHIVLGGNGWVPEGFGAALDEGPGGMSTYDISPLSACTRTVVGRHLFYNNSFYDGSGLGGSPAQCAAFLGVAMCNDNTAVANNRIALLPGQIPLIPPITTGHGLTTTSNYSSYTRGINGIMIDVQSAPGCGPMPARILTPIEIVSTLEFIEGGRAVNNAYTGAVRIPISVTIAPHPTLVNADRITVVFADNTSTNSRWLRCRLLPGGAVDGLGSEDRFYFGLAMADSLSVNGTSVIVNTIDQIDPKSDAHTTFTRALVDDRNDYNKDSIVNTIDQTLPKAPNVTTTFTCLQLTGVAP